MVRYRVFLFGAMLFVGTGCLSSTDPSIIGNGGSCAVSGDGGSGGEGGNLVEPCRKPKQVRIITQVSNVGQMAVNYDSLDRLEERYLDTLFPITELKVGDVLDVDPTRALQNEAVVVEKVGFGVDENGVKHRAFTATFSKPHLPNAPATEPIATGCPEFKMPVQEACTNDGAITDIGAACKVLVCYYGEQIIANKPVGTPCPYTIAPMDYAPGVCQSWGGCQKL